MAQHPLLDLRSQHGGEGVRSYRSRGDGVDAAANGPQVERHVGGQMVHGCLGGGVRSHVGILVLAGHGADVDDGAVAGPLHVGGAQLGEMEAGEDIELERPLELVERHVERKAGRRPRRC